MIILGSRTADRSCCPAKRIIASFISARVFRASWEEKNDQGWIFCIARIDFMPRACNGCVARASRRASRMIATPQLWMSEWKKLTTRARRRERRRN